MGGRAVEEARVEGVSHEQILALVDDIVPERPVNEDTSFFYVTNAAPEKRFHVDVPHCAPSRNHVMISEAIRVSSRPAWSEYTVQRLNIRIR